MQNEIQLLLSHAPPIRTVWPSTLVHRISADAGYLATTVHNALLVLLTAMLFAVCAAATAALSVYGYLLHERLTGSLFDRSVHGQPMPTDEKLLEESAKWTQVNVLDDARIADPTGKSYLVTAREARETSTALISRPCLPSWLPWMISTFANATFQMQSWSGRFSKKP